MTARPAPRRPDWLAATPPGGPTEPVQPTGGAAAAQDATVRWGPAWNVAAGPPARPRPSCSIRHSNLTGRDPAQGTRVQQRCAPAAADSHRRRRHRRCLPAAAAQDGRRGRHEHARHHPGRRSRVPRGAGAPLAAPRCGSAGGRRRLDRAAGALREGWPCMRVWDAMPGSIDHSHLLSAFFCPFTQQAASPPSAARPATSGAALPSRRLESLLAGRPATAPAPPPSSRLDALLSRPAPPAAGSASRREAAGAGLLAPALSPVAEEPRAGSAGRPAHRPTAAAAAAPAAQGWQLQRAAAPAPAPPAGLYGDPGLHDRLRQRIEQAKVRAVLRGSAPLVVVRCSPGLSRHRAGRCPPPPALPPCLR